MDAFVLPHPKLNYEARRGDYDPGSSGAWNLANVGGCAARSVLKLFDSEGIKKLTQGIGLGPRAGYWQGIGTPSRLRVCIAYGIGN